MDKKNFLDKINLLTKFHYEHSNEFKKIIDIVYKRKYLAKTLAEVPFLPVNLFKDMELKSISNKDVFKILNSSGTSSSKPSNIYLDKENAHRQTKVLNQIVSKILGSQRLPMIIVDENKEIENTRRFNAKTAAYLGFSIFGTNYFYLIKNGNIDYEGLANFLTRFSDQKFLIFGFTSKIYFEFLCNIDTKMLEKNVFSNAILIHGGGWKKLEQKKISNRKLKELFKNKLGLKTVYNYYGLIEQTGSIFFESKECGYFTTNEFSDIIIRGKNFEVIPNKKKGFIQLISTLPTSYPGHSILTEDIGEIINVENCKCGKSSKHFYIYGRAKESELRGCSDV